MSRFIGISSKHPFSEALIQTLRSNVHEYRAWVQNFMDENHEPSSSYGIEPPVISENGCELVIELTGTPTYFLLKMLEDGFPLRLLWDVDEDDLNHLKIRYQNEEWGISTGWNSLSEDRRTAIATRDTSRMTNG